MVAIFDGENLIGVYSQSERYLRDNFIIKKDTLAYVSFTYPILDKELSVKLKDWLTSYRYKRLEQIFTKKWLGIQAIAIDKEWITDPKAIQTQIDSYSKLADGAREILKNDPENATALSIVAKADEAKLLTFSANALMQQAKSKLADKISENDPKIDEKLSFVENFKMTKEDIADADKSAEMATSLITYLMS